MYKIAIQICSNSYIKENIILLVSLGELLNSAQKAQGTLQVIFRQVGYLLRPEDIMMFELCVLKLTLDTFAMLEASRAMPNSNA